MSKKQTNKHKHKHKQQTKQKNDHVHIEHHRFFYVHRIWKSCLVLQKKSVSMFWSKDSIRIS